MTITNKVLDVSHGGTGISGDGSEVAKINVETSINSNLANYASRLVSDDIGGDLAPVYFNDGVPVVATNASNIISSVANKYVTNLGDLTNILSTSTVDTSVIIGNSIKADTKQTITVNDKIKSISSGSRTTITLTNISLDFSSAPNCSVTNLTLMNGDISNANNLTRCTISDGSFISCNKLYSCKAISISSTPSTFNKCEDLFGCDGTRVQCGNLDTSNLDQITSDIDNLESSRFNAITSTSAGDLVSNIVSSGTTIKFDKVSASTLNVNKATYANKIVNSTGELLTLGNESTPVYISAGQFTTATTITDDVSTLKSNVANIISGTEIVGKSLSLSASNGVNTSLGDANNPVYFSNGIPVQTTAINTRLVSLESTRVNTIVNGTSYNLVTGLTKDGSTLTVTGTSFDSVTTGAAKRLVNDSGVNLTVGSDTELIYFKDGVPTKSGVSIGTDEGNIPKLGTGGRLPSSMLPETSLEYKDTLDAKTIDPSAETDTVPNANSYIDAIANKTKGDFYIAGASTNTSNASLATFTYDGVPYYDGDWILYNGTAWKKNSNNTRVSSVNNKVGAVTLNVEHNSASETATIKINGGTSAVTINNVAYAQSAGYAGGIGNATTSEGSATNPVYLLNGSITNCSYTLGSSVPSNAVIATDTTPSVGVSGTTQIGLNWNGTISSPITVPYATNAGKVAVATYTSSNFSLLAGDTISGDATVYADANLKFNASSKKLTTDNIECTNSLTVNGWTFSIDEIS